MYDVITATGSFTIRLVIETINGIINGAFVAKDVAEALGYSKSSIEHLSRLFKHVDKKHLVKRRIPITYKNGTICKREITCITLEGLYQFLAKSRKPKAKEFARWIEEIVVPYYLTSKPQSTSSTITQNAKQEGEAVIDSNTNTTQVEEQPTSKIVHELEVHEPEVQADSSADSTSTIQSNNFTNDSDDDDFDRILFDPARSDKPFRKELMSFIKDETKKPKSSVFKKWIAEKVIPYIMRIGEYSYDEFGTMRPKPYLDDNIASNYITTEEYNGNSVTSLHFVSHKFDNNHRWFVAEDVIAVYGYSRDSLPTIMNTFMKGVDSRWVKKLSIYDSPREYDGNPRKGDTLCFSEQAVYYFMLSCDSPHAKQFQEWIDYEVLPAIAVNFKGYVNHDLRKRSNDRLRNWLSN